MASLTAWGLWGPRWQAQGHRLQVVEALYGHPGHWRLLAVTQLQKWPLNSRRAAQHLLEGSRGQGLVPAAERGGPGWHAACLW